MHFLFINPYIYVLDFKYYYIVTKRNATLIILNAVYIMWFILIFFISIIII